MCHLWHTHAHAIADVTTAFLLDSRLGSRVYTPVLVMTMDTALRFVGTISLGVLVGLSALAGGCSKKASAPPKLGYSTDLKELRDRFNNDRGKVRLLLILSPT